MNAVLCPNNHYYDSDVHASCPFCAASGTVGVTMPAGGAEIGVTQAPGMGGSAGEAFSADPPRRPVEGQTEIAPPFGGDPHGGEKFDPVVGWLVCVDGNDKGRDYRIHSDNNYIGRGENMDVVIRNDETITREKHAIITYDTREKVFYFAQGGGRGVVRLNGKAVLTMMELKRYDTMEIGNTKLLFVPLCGEGFDWSEE